MLYINLPYDVFSLRGLCFKHNNVHSSKLLLYMFVTGYGNRVIQDDIIACYNDKSNVMKIYLRELVRHTRTVIIEHMIILFRIYLMR